MGLDKELDTCLASQQIRDRFRSGWIVGNLDESRIQPSSFEPTIGDEIFILDTETEGVFRPQDHESVYRTLLQLPQRQRRRVSIADGFEVKKGFTYLLPLEERVILKHGEYLKSSPKSTTGRDFLHSRLLTDFNPCFDEIISGYMTKQELAMWLLIQPLAFNLIIHPGISLNQLRFFTGRNAELVPEEILQEFIKTPLLFTKEDNRELVPAKAIVTDGLQLHLDLSGRHTEGIVGLRARHNPEPIDMMKVGEYNAEDFFEPLLSDSRKTTIKNGEYYLLASAEVLKIPSHLNAELAAHSHIGISGPLHFAGFIDNGFEGDLVYEVRSDELSNMVLEDGMPISRLKICRTDIPDKLYGKKIGSNYQGQVGPRPAKYFRPFDYTYAARNYKKLDRMVLVQDAKMLLEHRETPEGFEFISPERAEKLYEDIGNGFFLSRYDCETDESVLQLIPYVVVFGNFGPDKLVFQYVRARNIEDYGDKRLFNKHSIGLGGHVVKSDGPDYIRRCLEREVMEEEVEIVGRMTEPKLVGTLMAYDREVDRVHFGLVFGIRTYGTAPIHPKESSIISGRMVLIDKLIADPDLDKKYETWSRMLVPHLPEILKRVPQVI